MSADAAPEAGLHARLDRSLGWLENAALVVAGAAMVAAMVLTAVDAVARYALNSPLSFQQYLTENYLMVALVNLAFAWGFRTGGYIRIESLLLVLPKPIAMAIMRIGLLAGALFVATLAWMAGAKFVEAYVSNAVQFGEIDWSVSWSWVWVPIGCGLLAARLLLTAFGPERHLRAGHSAEDPV
jgi:TRAP-type C4-dicarboxylate transport system permease small subunit